MGIEFSGYRYVGPGIQSLPTTAAATAQALPNDTSSKIAKWYGVMAIGSTQQTGINTAYVKFLESSAVSSATVLDMPVCAYETKIVSGVGFKFISVIAENANTKVNIFPLESG